MPKLTLTLLWSSALVFAAIGVFFLVTPDAAAASIGIELTNPTARTDITATYGGLMVGIGLFFGWTAQHPERYRAGLWFTLVAYAGLGLGRTWAIVGGERPGVMMWSFLGIELTVAVLAGLCLNRMTATQETL